MWHAKWTWCDSSELWVLWGCCLNGKYRIGFVGGIAKLRLLNRCTDWKKITNPYLCTAIPNEKNEYVFCQILPTSQWYCLVSWEEIFFKCLFKFPCPTQWCRVFVCCMYWPFLNVLFRALLPRLKINVTLACCKMGAARTPKPFWPTQQGEKLSLTADLLWLRAYFSLLSRTLFFFSLISPWDS